MAWTAPVTRATGYLVLASDWNNEHVNDLLYLKCQAFGTHTSDVSSVGTTFSAGADILASALNFTADGATNYLLRVRSTFWTNSSTSSGNYLHINLDGADAGIMALRSIAVAEGAYDPNADGYIVEPNSGAHTVNARLRVDSGTGTLRGGPGGAGQYQPIFVGLYAV